MTGKESERLRERLERICGRREGKEEQRCDMLMSAGVALPQGRANNLPDPITKLFDCNMADRNTNTAVLHLHPELCVC